MTGRLPPPSRRVVTGRHPAVRAGRGPAGVLGLPRVAGPLVIPPHVPSPSRYPTSPALQGAGGRGCRLTPAWLSRSSSPGPRLRTSSEGLCRPSPRLQHRPVRRGLNSWLGLAGARRTSRRPRSWTMSGEVPRRWQPAAVSAAAEGRPAGFRVSAGRPGEPARWGRGPRPAVRQILPQGRLGRQCHSLDGGRGPLRPRLVPHEHRLVRQRRRRGGLPFGANVHAGLPGRVAGEFSPPSLLPVRVSRRSTSWGLRGPQVPGGGRPATGPAAAGRRARRAAVGGRTRSPVRPPASPDSTTLLSRSRRWSRPSGRRPPRLSPLHARDRPSLFPSPTCALSCFFPAASSMPLSRRCATSQPPRARPRPGSALQQRLLLPPLAALKHLTAPT